MGARPEEMEGGARRHRRIERHGLGLEGQNLSARAKWRDWSRPRKGVRKNHLTASPVVRDGMTARGWNRRGWKPRFESRLAMTLLALRCQFSGDPAIQLYCLLQFLLLHVLAFRVRHVN